MKFYWKAKGTANDHYSTGEFTAESEESAQIWLDDTFGIKRNKKGEQINSDMIDASLVNEANYKELQKLALEILNKE